MKTIELENEVLEFALQRCEADIALGKAAAEQAAWRINIAAGKKMMDYVVMVKRLQAALEKAK